MRKVKYSKAHSAYFYIGSVGNKVVIISAGPHSPFDHVSVLQRSIRNITDRLKTEKVEIYVDLLSWLGDRTNRFYKMFYNKKEDKFDILSIKEIDRKHLPQDIKATLRKFYKDKLEEIIEHSVLTKTEKRNVRINPI